MIDRLLLELGIDGDAGKKVSDLKLPFGVAASSVEESIHL